MLRRTDEQAPGAIGGGAVDKPALLHQHSHNPLESPWQTIDEAP